MGQRSVPDTIHTLAELFFVEFDWHAHCVQCLFLDRIEGLASKDLECNQASLWQVAELYVSTKWLIRRGNFCTHILHKRRSLLMPFALSRCWKIMGKYGWTSLLLAREDHIFVLWFYLLEIPRFWGPPSCTGVDVRGVLQCHTTCLMLYALRDAHLMLGRSWRGK